MSINNTHRQKTKFLSNRHSYNLLANPEYEPYSDEGNNVYHSTNFKNGKDRKKKRILKYKYRSYRTWKHNREQQYKMQY